MTIYMTIKCDKCESQESKTFASMTTVLEAMHSVRHDSNGGLTCLKCINETKAFFDLFPVEVIRK